MYKGSFKNKNNTDSISLEFFPSKTLNLESSSFLYEKNLMNDENKAPSDDVENKEEKTETNDAGKHPKQPDTCSASTRSKKKH